MKEAANVFGGSENPTARSAGGVSDANEEATVRQGRTVATMLVALVVGGTSALAEPVREFIDPSTGMEFLFVKGGTFDMGDLFMSGDGIERPVHKVTVSDFSIGKFEVTQAQWEKVMGSNPSAFKGPDRPVEKISWEDAQEFLRRLNEKSRGRYRLPTEAEWEYAARSGGREEKWAGTSDEKEVGDRAWYYANSGGETHPVGQKKPNVLGLYDMSGNVWEWVQDWSSIYAAGDELNPTGPATGDRRVRRGGSVVDAPNGVRTAKRSVLVPSYKNGSLGFRVVKPAD